MADIGNKLFPYSHWSFGPHPVKSPDASRAAGAVCCALPAGELAGWGVCRGGDRCSFTCCTGCERRAWTARNAMRISGADKSRTDNCDGYRNGLDALRRTGRPTRSSRTVDRRQRYADGSACPTARPSKRSNRSDQRFTAQQHSLFSGSKRRRHSLPDHSGYAFRIGCRERGHAVGPLLGSRELLSDFRGYLNSNLKREAV